jgi:sugar phosphate isomerase/epimerase
MQRLLNFSTHPGEPEMFDNDWQQAARFLERWEFDGFELYPVGDYPCECIPAELVTGLHLRFFVILAPIWRNDRKRLLQIFGDWETVAAFYGGVDAACIRDAYARQLDLARHLGCAYVVFHPVHCELEYVYDWRFPWQVDDTLALCAEVINAAVRRSAYDGWILFENLWWPGSFQLADPREYDHLRSRVDYPRCGIALDTGHLMNRNPDLADERQAVEYMLSSIEHLGALAADIRTVHLTRSLSGDYIRHSRRQTEPYRNARDFWQRLDIARRHVGCIDRHDPFEEPHVAAVLEKAAPDHVVFEFTFHGMAQWENKIARQKNALRDYLWPRSERRLTGVP